MPRAGPRKVYRYSDEFKLTAVRLSQQPGIQVQTVAAALGPVSMLPQHGGRTCWTWGAGPATSRSSPRGWSRFSKPSGERCSAAGGACSLKKAIGSGALEEQPLRLHRPPRSPHEGHAVAPRLVAGAPSRPAGSTRGANAKAAFHAQRVARSTVSCRTRWKFTNGSQFDAVIGRARERLLALSATAGGVARSVRARESFAGESSSVAITPRRVSSPVRAAS